MVHTQAGKLAGLGADQCTIMVHRQTGKTARYGAQLGWQTGKLGATGRVAWWHCGGRAKGKRARGGGLEGGREIAFLARQSHPSRLGYILITSSTNELLDPVR